MPLYRPNRRWVSVHVCLHEPPDEIDFDAFHSASHRQSLSINIRQQSCSIQSSKFKWNSSKIHCDSSSAWRCHWRLALLPNRIFSFIICQFCQSMWTTFLHHNRIAFTSMNVGRRKDDDASLRNCFCFLICFVSFKFFILHFYFTTVGRARFFISLFIDEHWINQLMWWHWAKRTDSSLGDAHISKVIHRIVLEFNHIFLNFAGAFLCSSSFRCDFKELKISNKTNILQVKWEMDELLSARGTTNATSSLNVFGLSSSKSLWWNLMKMTTNFKDFTACRRRAMGWLCKQ